MRRFSEPYGVTGGLAAEGVLNQLGRPDIDPLEVLVREAVQNCWDARRPDEPSVHVEIGKLRLDEEAARFLRSRVLVDPPAGLALRHQLSGQPTILYFADRGTTGLGGPTRGDRAVERSNADFADFVFNIGQPPDKELGGGSFGYGKAAFFIASAAHTIIVDTLCAVGGAVERRLIACALGDGFVEDGVPHTGRHWWGQIREGSIAPVLGAEAAEIADRLGLPARPGADDRGTTVAIVAPDLDPEDGVPTPISMSFVAEALAWNFWPKMIGGGGTGPTMTFTVRDEGAPVLVPDPRRHPRLRPFTDAMDRLREDPDEEGGEVEDAFVVDRPIVCRKPRQHLGRLVVQRTIARPDTSPQDGPQPLGAALTAGGLHHVALMRNAELVVRYLPGRDPATGRHGYAGVFRCALAVDAAFRQSEPPTHDDWVWRAVPSGWDRTFVKVALQRIQDVCRDVAGVPASADDPHDGEDVPLGAFADSLAALMPSLSGTGARRIDHPTARRAAVAGGGASSGTPQSEEEGRNGPWSTDGAEVVGRDGGPAGLGSGVTPGGEGPAVRVLGAPELRMDPELGPVLASPFQLRTAGAAARLRAQVEVMTGDGGQREEDPPTGWKRPTGRCWIAPAGDEIREPEPAVSGESADGAWWVLVPVEPDTMLRVDITATRPGE